jgi:hypothetical protein
MVQNIVNTFKLRKVTVEIDVQLEWFASKKMQLPFQ